jgi:hypothetical protein
LLLLMPFARLAVATSLLVFSAPLASASRPVDPLRFFEGRTVVDGTVKVMFHKPYRTHSDGQGVMKPDGSLSLVQRVVDEGKEPHDRKWRVRPVGEGTFTAMMSEAIGPVTIQQVGDSFRFRYKMKGKLSVEQILTPMPDGRSARNVGKVKRMGVTVATTTGVIRKV